jgi:hypothetical protein
MQPGFRRSSEKNCTDFCIASVEIEPTIFPAGDVALTTGIPSSKQGNRFFSNLLEVESKKGNFFLNPAAEQDSSPQGCTVRAKAAPDRGR